MFARARKVCFFFQRAVLPGFIGKSLGCDTHARAGEGAECEHLVMESAKSKEVRSMRRRNYGLPGWLWCSGRAEKNASKLIFVACC